MPSWPARLGDRGQNEGGDRSSTWQSWGGLTQRHQEPAGLHHHLLVQGPLVQVQLPPFLTGEGHGHILEGHRHLESQTGSISLGTTGWDQRCTSQCKRYRETKHLLRAELCARLWEADTALHWWQLGRWQKPTMWSQWKGCWIRTSYVDCEAQNGEDSEMSKEWKWILMIIKTIPVIITATALNTHWYLLCACLVLRAFSLVC